MPRIETERLILLPPTMEDLDGLAAAWGDPDVTRYLPGGRPRSRERTAAGLQEFIRHWDEHGFGFWSLLYKADGGWIGYCGLQHVPDRPEVELAYGLAKPYWGQGFTTEAAVASLRFGFEELGLERIVAYAVPANVPSTRVMEHAGMVSEQPTHIYGADVAQYAISRAQFTPGRARYVLRRRTFP